MFVVRAESHSKSNILLGSRNALIVRRRVLECCAPARPRQSCHIIRAVTAAVKDGRLRCVGCRDAALVDD